MPEDYPQEKLQEIYEALPEDLQDAIFSEENAEDVSDICIKNGLEEDKISEVLKYIGYVLLGLLPPYEFEKTLKEKLVLNDDLAKKISIEINSSIFLSLKPTLEMIYKTEIKSSPLNQSKEEKTTKGRPKKDTYRELVE